MLSIERDNQPLVSLLILAYQQQTVVAETVASAFAQQYSPLEILLSDDCSGDETFRVMRELADAYQGPHKIVINRNSRNLGYGAHINFAMELANGELVVMMGGDDVSMPERVGTIVRAWTEDARRASLVHSSAVRITTSGHEVGVVRPIPAMIDNPTARDMVRKNLHVIGATAAWTPLLFEKFGPLADNVICEDLVLPFRAALTGGVLYVDQPLVKHREGGLSGDFERLLATGHEFLFGTRVKWGGWWREAYRQRLADYLTTNEGDPEVIEICEREIFKWDTTIRLAESSYLGRFKIARQMAGSPLASTEWKLKTLFAYLLPPIYAAQFNLRNRLRERSKRRVGA